MCNALCTTAIYGIPNCKILYFHLLYSKAVLKIVDHVQGQGANPFKSGAYTTVFEHFESVCNAALGR